MAPATSSLFAGLPHDHLSGLAGGAAAILVVRLSRGHAALDALSWLLVFTGGVHVGLVFGHIADQPVLSALFMVDGLAYFGLVALRRNRWWWRPATGSLLLGTILAYLIYTGAGHEQPDPVGILDKLAELVALGLVMLPPERSASDGRGPSSYQKAWRRPLRWLIASGGTLGLTFVASTALWGEDLAGAAHVHGVVICAPNHHPAPGTVLRQVPCTVSPQQQAAADRLVAETRQAIAPYESVQVALAAGYRPGTPDGTPTVHYGARHPGSRPLDPSHPAALVYANTRQGPMLLGAMYQMPKQGQPGPDIGGALTPWHYHTNVCISLPGLFISGLSTPFGQCPPWSIRISTADQLHVWTAPNPNGPFGDLDEAWARRL